MMPRFVQLGRVGIKICGITSHSNAMEVAGAGADALGFNFWPRSKRYLDPGEFEAWAQDLPDEVERVGVFVNAPLERVLQLLEGGAIHVAQLHGDEGRDYCVDIARRYPTLKAYAVESAESLAAISGFGGAVLLDAYCPGEYGGGGEPFDWELGRRFAAENPEEKVVLAGGLNPGNVAKAVRGVRPAAVDVASGVELEPGVKDLVLVREFVAAALGG